MTDQPSHTPRANLRLLSHTIVDVRPWRYLPLFTQSSYLLDINANGVQLEFITDPRITTGKKYWSISHLTPLGITSVNKLRCYLECRWLNPKTCKMGGQFIDLSETDKQTIDLILRHIRDRG